MFFLYILSPYNTIYLDSFHTFQNSNLAPTVVPLLKYLYMLEIKYIYIFF